MSTTALSIATVLVLSAVPACNATSGTPTTSTIAPPTTRTVHTTQMDTLKWGQLGAVRSGVTVQLHKPVPVSPATVTWRVPDDAPAGGHRELVCDVVVYNGSAGHVRIGVSGRAGLVELIPKHETAPAVAPHSAGTVRRLMLAPVFAPTITVQVSATVDGVPVSTGWTFSGGTS